MSRSEVSGDAPEMFERAQLIFDATPPTRANGTAIYIHHSRWRDDTRAHFVGLARAISKAEGRL